MKLKTLTVIIFVVLLIGGWFAYKNLSGGNTICWPYCPGMTDQDRDEIKKSAMQTWKTYQNAEYKFTFKYPPNLVVSGDSKNIRHNDFACRSITDFAEATEVERNKNTDNDTYSVVTVCVVDIAKSPDLNTYNFAESDAVIDMKGYKIWLSAPVSFVKEIKESFKQL